MKWEQKNGFPAYYLFMNFRDLWVRSIVNITSNSDKYSDLSNETSTVSNVSAETHMSLCERETVVRACPGIEARSLLNVKAIIIFAIANL